jgi:competence protein ComEA
MPERDPRRYAAWAAAVLVLLLLTGWYLARSRPTAGASVPPPAAISVAQADDGGGRTVVDVAGAVHRPGVYTMPGGARVEDALKRAGGATRRADLSQINRAAKLEDGRQILVPLRPRPGTVTAAPAPGAPAQPVNLNTATLDQLDQLDGVGPAMAQKILDFRKAHGGFGTVDDLDQIPGIGEKRMAALRDHVRV